MLSAIIVAAGSSSRAGFDKMFAEIAGRSVIQHSLEAFERAGFVDEIVVVCRAAAMGRMRELIASAAIGKARIVVPGRERRQDSVRAGLSAISSSADFVAVHDGARPLITPAEIERVFFAAQKRGAAVLARRITDTLKTVDADEFVSGSIDRANVFAMETPQIFARQLIVDGYERVAAQSLSITDEVSAVQACGGKVAVVPAREHNMKITLVSDLELAELILRCRQASSS